jgi:hypothetical protein
MDSNQISQAIAIGLRQCEANKRKESDNKYIFLGVMAIDELKDRFFLRNNHVQACVLNASVLNSEGSHWFIFAVDLLNGKPGHAIIFDSLARHDIETYYPLLHNFLTTLPIKYYIVNKNPVQDAELDSCGLHSVYFILLYLGQKMSYEDILKTYSRGNLLRNDCQLLKNHLNLLLCPSDTPFAVMYNQIFNLINDLDATVSKCEESA